jgi:nitronate monooxygenase
MVGSPRFSAKELAMWPDRRLLDLFGIEVPILQAPMAGAQGSALAIAVSEAGGLGALPCALLSAAQIRSELQIIRQRTDKPFNLNFFCHTPPAADPEREARWVARLASYRRELGVAVETLPGGRAPFGEETCALVEEFRPKVVSFHFGLPEADLLARVRATGAIVLASATTVAEARWLDARGVDAIIAQGAEAGGHRGMFLSEDVAAQPGTFALVPQVVDAVRVPVIAAGGIGDGRGIAAAFMLGAAGVQIGTAYLLSDEATISPIYRAGLKAARDDQTVLTNVFTGRPARGIVNRAIREIGPMSADAPAFPGATNAMLPLRQRAEAQGSGDFTSMWSGQAPVFAREGGAGRLTQSLAADALRLFGALSKRS